MKELINFIKWQWSKWEFWQKAFIFSSFFFGAALVAEPPYVFYLSLVPMTVVFGFMTKWMIWDGTKAAWDRYKQEKANLFNTIKDGK